MDNGFSQSAIQLLNAIAASAPRHDNQSQIGPNHVLRYLAGVLPYGDAIQVETAALRSLALRKSLSETVVVLDGFQETVFDELVDSLDPSNSSAGLLQEWIAVINRQVDITTSNLRGAIPTTWPAISRMAQEGFDGLIAAQTIWRAIFQMRNMPPERTPIQLGFGYRRGSTGSMPAAQILTHLEVMALSNGNLEVIASTEFGPREGSIFFAYTLNGKALALAEARIKNGQVRVVVEGLAQFLQLPAGQVLSSTLAARIGDWPEECKFSQLLVESGVDAAPKLEMPVIRNGILELNCYFESPQLDGRWELLLAITPNCWQMLARFDIKCVIERPQVLKATMPETAREGPFGGALWLRRQ
jgi:hypothetical protein